MTPTPFDDLRSGFLRLLRETIDEHINTARAEAGGACSVDDVRRVREGLVSRLVDVLQEQGEQVHGMPVAPRESALEG